jgi:hypothetical protein
MPTAIATNLTAHRGNRPAKLPRNLTYRESCRQAPGDLFTLARLERSRGAPPGSRLEPAGAPQNVKNTNGPTIQALANLAKR